MRALNRWFLFFLRRSVVQRRGRFVIASVAVVLAVSVVTALVTLSTGMREKIGQELEQYGANMIVVDRGGRAMAMDDAVAVRTISPHIRGSAFELYGAAELHGATFEVIGIEPGKAAGFRIEGEPPRKSDELMVGINLKDAVSGSRTVAFDNGMAFVVTGVFQKGPEQDSSFVMTIEGAQRFLGIRGVSAVLLNVDPGSFSAVEEAVAASFPGLEVKRLRQVAVAAERVLGKIELLMMLVTVVVLLSSFVALGSTMGANVIERREEIGLMKALGATRADIRRFFLSEALLAGFFGAVAGYVLGIVVAEAVSVKAFGSYVPVSVRVVVASVVSGMIISAVSTYFPVRDAMRFNPAAILRGE